MSSVRVAMGVEYDGTDFHGWQAQRSGVRSVQSCIEAAIGAVADHPVTVHCAGRTDAGVHAFEQVIHFESGANRNERAWVLGTNVNLPTDRCVRWAAPVEETFHARFSAVARHYRYRILRAAPVPRWSAIARCGFTKRWNPERVNAASALVGEHDFSSFRAVACQAKSPIRTLYYLDRAPRGRRDRSLLGQRQWLPAPHGTQHRRVLIAIGRGDAPVERTQSCSRCATAGSAGSRHRPRGCISCAPTIQPPSGYPKATTPIPQVKLPYQDFPSQHGVALDSGQRPARKV